MATLNIKLIGCGGIGGHLAPNLCRFLHADRRACHVTLVDGDEYEPRNRARMCFDVYENKARVMAKELARAFGDVLTVEPVPEYVSPTNIGTIVREGELVFLAVDNHATRKLVAEHCERLRDVTLFSGGNDGIENGKDGAYGNAQIMHRADGRPLTNTLTRFHPEIAEPGDRLPADASCVKLAQTSAPQLLFTNLAVASAMLNSFYGVLHHAITYEEVYLDIVKNRVVPVRRAPP